MDSCGRDRERHSAEPVFHRPSRDDLRRDANGQRTLRLRPTCAPLENGTPLEGQLDAALANLQAEYTLADDREDAQEESDTLDADPDTRNFSYVVKDDTVYYRENSKMRAVKASTSALARIKRLSPCGIPAGS